MIYKPQFVIYYKLVCSLLLLLADVGYIITITGFSLYSPYVKLNILGLSASTTTTVRTVNEFRDPITILEDYILVRPKPAIRENSFQIILPDQFRVKYNEADVLATGPGKLHPHTGIRITSPVSIGMSVLYGATDENELKYNNEILHIVNGEDVLLFYHGPSMTKHNVKPCRDYILVKPVKGKLQTDSGIYFSSSLIKREDDRANIGTVFKVGDGRTSNTGKNIESPFKVAQKVKFKSYSSIKVTIEDEEYLLVRMVDILCASVS